MTEFEVFQSTFIKYQNLLGLTGYKVYFKYEVLDSCFANIMINQEDMVVTVVLNKRVMAKDKLHRNIQNIAKHEALHLLMGRLDSLAKYRYATSVDIYEANEEIVHKLEELIE